MVGRGRLKPAFLWGSLSFLFAACGELGIFPIQSSQGVVQAVGEGTLQDLNTVATMDTTLTAAQEAAAASRDLDALASTLSKSIGSLPTVDEMFSIILPAPPRKASSGSDSEFPVELAVLFNIVEESVGRDFYALSSDPRVLNTWLSLFKMDSSKPPVSGTNVTVRDPEVCAWGKANFKTSSLCVPDSGSSAASSSTGSTYGYGTSGTSSSASKNGYTVDASIGTADELGFPIEVTIDASIYGATVMLQERFHVTSAWSPSTGRIEWLKAHVGGAISFLQDRTEELSVNVHEGKAYDPVEDRLVDSPGSRVTVLVDTTTFVPAAAGVTKGVATFYRGSEEWQKLEWFKEEGSFKTIWIGPQQIVRLVENERHLTRAELKILANEYTRDGSMTSGTFEAVLTVDQRNLSRPTETYERWKRTLSFTEQLTFQDECSSSCKILDASGSASETVEIQSVGPAGEVLTNRILRSERALNMSSEGNSKGGNVSPSWANRAEEERTSVSYFEEVSRWVKSSGTLSIRAEGASKDSEVRLTAFETKEGTKGYRGTARTPSGEDLEFTLTSAPAKDVVSRVEFILNSASLSGTLDYDKSGNAVGSLTVRNESYTLAVSRQARTLTITDAKGAATSVPLDSGSPSEA